VNHLDNRSREISTLPVPSIRRSNEYALSKLVTIKLECDLIAPLGCHSVYQKPTKMYRLSRDYIQHSRSCHLKGPSLTRKNKKKLL
jgi:hypothetical protein